MPSSGARYLSNPIPSKYWPNIGDIDTDTDIFYFLIKTGDRSHDTSIDPGQYQRWYTYYRIDSPTPNAQTGVTGVKPNVFLFAVVKS